MMSNIGYLIDRNYWEQNLATEATPAIINLGFEKYNLPCLMVINPNNTASKRVAEKIGMKYEKMFYTVISAKSHFYVIEV
jgi:ribosomal-protein-alanine N-acetyltransferase